MRAKTLQIVWHEKQPVFSVDFHPDGYLATGGADREIKVRSCGCCIYGGPPRERRVGLILARAPARRAVPPPGRPPP